MTLFFGVVRDCFPGPGLGPAADSLSFASPKESKQRKGDPTVCVPPLRYGQPAVLDVGGGPQNSLHYVALRQLRPLSLLRLRSSAQPEGIDPRHRCARLLNSLGLAFASLGHRFDSVDSTTTGIHSRHGRREAPAVPWGPSEAKARASPLPSGCAEERSVSRIRARSCLSEASSARPRETRAPQVARSEAEGRRQWGRLFFAYFLLAKQKKVGRPPGRVPASGSKANAVTQSV